MTNKREVIQKIIAIVIVLAFVCANTSFANASIKSDLSLAKSWVKSHYSEPIKVVSCGKVPSNRIGTVYIETLKTKSKGGTKGVVIGTNWCVKYPKKVKKGKKVTVYFVYNPYNNACDDVVAMVCLGKIK